jgi:hypothetical protein
MEALQAAMKPTLQMQALQAAMKPTLQMEALQAAMKPTLQMEALQAAMKPTLQMEALQAAMKPTLQMQALQAAMKPSLQMEALQAAMKPILQMEALQAAMKSTLQMEALQAAMKPILQMEALQAAMKPTLQMQALQAAMKPTLQMEALQAAMKPTLQMQAFQAAIKSTSQIEEIIAAASTLPTMASLRNVLGFPRKAGSIADSFSSAVEIGASLAAMGSMSRLASVEQRKLSPYFADALSTAAKIFHEDDDRHNRLTDLFTHFQNPANDDEISEQPGISGNEIAQELSAAAQSGDLNQISDRAKRHFIFVLWLIGALLSSIAIASAVRTEACQWQPTVWPSMTSGQKGKAIRKAACDVPTEVKKDHRYVHGAGVRLRSSPSMKGAIQPEVLYDGELLEVLSLENRDWLKVSIVGKSESEGWVSRRYVRAIIR